MKYLLKIVAVLVIFKSIEAINLKYLVGIDKCKLFEFTFYSMKVFKASGIYAIYKEFSVKPNGESNLSAHNTFYQYIEVYDKTKDSFVCEKVRSYCTKTKVILSNADINRDCFKIKGIN
jgi:hypothetical protein